MFAIAWWAICDAISAFLHDQEIILSISLLSYIGILGAPVFWLLFTLEFSGIRRISIKRGLPVMIAVYSALITFVQLDPVHHLIYESSYKNQGDFSSSYSYNWGFWIIVVVVYSGLFFGSAILIRTAWNSLKMQRQSIYLLVIAAIIPWIGNLIYLSRLFPIAGFDLTPSSFAITGIIILYAIYRRSLFSLQPLAYQKLFSHLSDSVLLFDSQKRMVDSNQKAKELFNLSSIDHDISKKFHSQFGLDLNETLEKADSDKELNLEIRPIHPDSPWYLLSIRQILSSKNTANGFMVSIKDISNWKKNEFGLQLNTRILSQIGLMGEEMLRKGEWRELFIRYQRELISASEAIAAMLYIPKQYDGQEEHIYSSPVHKEILDKALAFSQKQSLTNISQVYIWTEYQIAQIPLDLEKRDKAIWFIVWDKDKQEYARYLTDALKLAANIIASGMENEKTSRDLKQSREDAIVASNVKSEFLSIMSHEIRTPLNAIVGLTHYLKEEIKDPSLEDKIKTLDYSANNLHILVNDILDYNKIEAGKLELFEENFDLTELLENILQENKLKADEVGNSIELYLSDEFPRFIKGDKLRFTQIVNNLVSNAVKFTQNGQVKVSLSKISETTEHVEIALSVEDTGKGIPEDFLPKLFSKFTQLSTTSTRQFGGTGLGLAISKRLIELMNGDITVKSELGVGSCFTVNAKFLISKTENLANDQKQIETDFDKLKNKRILLVEDNKVNIFVAITFLKKWNCIAQIAENGEEAVEKLRSEDFDLVLMDLQMPVMDGYEATKKIREFNSEVPIIALTASALLDSKEVSKLAGMNDYITKPFKPDELYQTLVRYVIR